MATAGHPPRVVLVDSGGTNIASVKFALERLGVSCELTADAATIQAADRVILPGVGAAGAGMRRLGVAGLVPVLQGLTQPLLGVCLGMQLLFEASAEDGGVQCLALIPGEVEPITPGPGLRVPHMGWNTLQVIREDPLTSTLKPGDRGYFVHSYAAPITEHTVASTWHGRDYAAVVRRGNRWGAQFHPERSASVGAAILAHFVWEASHE
ncbi:MAG: imidazole glycerol phosphate synthase subunit HisH [Ornithinimicrobium sp.]